MARSPSAASPPDHDQWGIDALRLMLEDLEFPRRADALRDRVGAWRVPMPGQETIRLGRLLEPFGDRRFRSSGALLKALKKRWPDLSDPSGPWVANELED